ncbi:MAG: 2-oxoacid:acceptor oxidoreductase family protein [Candidatus Aminicenantes bacterium]|nr:2-oxoacid:acceptor oxidoreductase family protein [Candidatus Aminicenantes bacterium]
MIEVRFHGRGGQGSVTAARILANAFVREGKYGSSFPMFGFERRGAPVTAFLRFDDHPIKLKTQIYNPDCLVVLDASLRNSEFVYEGLKPNSVLIVNGVKNLTEKPHKNIRLLGMVDAETIALEEIGVAAPNTCMVGAFAAATGWISLESVLISLEDYFSDDLLRRNVRSAERGFREVRLTPWPK